MSENLTKEIIKHIYDGFIKKSNKFLSLKSDDFKILDTLFIQDDDGKTHNRNIWSIDIIIQNKILNVILADCSIHNSGEFAMLIAMQDCPSYGIYSSLNGDISPLIAVSAQGDSWSKCNVFLQASLLISLESIKDIIFSVNKSENNKISINNLKSFINYYNSFYEKNEG